MTEKGFRWRRGQLVEIPAEWLGKTTHDQTIRKRPSKYPYKMRKEIKHGRKRRDDGPQISEFG